MKVCPKCRKLWNDEKKFCSNDGSQLDIVPEDPMEALIGKVLNRTYMIEAKLGQGGMGTVFRAKHIGIGDIVAIKVISPQHTQNKDSFKRFRREAQAVRRLAHPNAVAVHDFNMTEEGLLFMVMEYVNGITLEDYLKERRYLSPERTLEILRPVTDALDVAHSLGIIHRDLKPANLMLCKDSRGREQIKILDFGTARFIFQEAEAGDSQSSNLRITLQGQICGTPVYMSPEQAMDEKITAATDIYSMGIVLYQLLTATVPFLGTNTFDTLRGHVESSPEPPSQRLTTLPNVFDPIVLKALEKLPENRYETAGAMADALAEVVKALNPNAFASKPSYATVTLSPLADDLQQQMQEMTIEDIALPNFNIFVKRENEFRRLQHELHNAREGNPRPTFVISSPGVGKSELLNRFKLWATKEGNTVLSGKFVDYGGHTSEPLIIFKKMLISALPNGEINSNSSSAVINEQLRAHYGLEAATKDGDVNKWQLFEELNQAFAKIVKTKSLIMLLDDLHWADLMSLDYLGYLLRNNSLNICFVGTARTEETESKGHQFREWLTKQTSYFPYERIDLVTFDAEGIRTWLQRVFRVIDITQQDVKRLTKITDGNPFYLGEVVRLLIDNKTIEFQNGIWRTKEIGKVKIPHSINNIVKYKLENSSESLRALLEHAAVIGDEFTFELLQMVSDVDEEEMEKLLVDGVKAFLLRGEDKGAQGDNFRFYQSAIRYVIYEEIPARKRRRIHLKVAETLTKLYKTRVNKVLSALTYHYHAAGQWEQAFIHGLPAIEKALQQQMMGDVLRVAKYLEDANENISDKEGDKEWQRTIGQLKIWKLAALTRLARLEEAEAESKKCQEFIEKLGDPALDLALQGLLTELCFWGNRYQDGVAIGTLARSRAYKTNDEKSAGSILFYLGMCQGRVSKLADAIATFEELNSMSERMNNQTFRASALCGIAFFSHFLGEWRKSHHYFQQALEVAHAVNDRYYECMAQLFLAWTKEYECQPKAIELHYSEALKVARACGWRNLEGYSYFVAGRSKGCALEPNFELAQDFLATGQAIMKETNDIAGQLFIAHASAVAEARANPSIETLAKLKYIVEILTKKGEKLNNCRTMCEQGYTEIKIGFWAEAFTSFQNALELATKIPFMDCQWRAYYGLARCYQHQGETNEALSHTMMAISIINRLQQEFDTDSEKQSFLDDKQQIYSTYAELCG